MKTGLLIVSLGLLAATAWAEPGVRSIDAFENGLAPGWEEKSFQGHTEYRVVAEGDGHVLQADSRAAASGLIYKIDYDLKNWPVLAWRWKIDQVLAKGDAHTKAGDDYAARVYVVFPHWFFPKTKSINYIWANKLPQGEVIPNPFIGNARMVAVESGPARAGEWVEERRNVLDDYRKIFGEEPPAVGAIAIMTDTDNTGETTRAWYDDLRLEK